MSHPPIQLVFLALAMGAVYSMKGVSLAMASGRWPENLWLFLVSPLPSVKSWPRVSSADGPGVLNVLRQAGSGLLLAAPAYGLYWALVPPLGLSWLWISYLAVLPAFLSGLVVGPVTRLSLLPLGLLMPPFHGRDIGGASLTGFWGNGWNLWMSDWFRQATFIPFRRTPRRASFLAFLVSGLVHEPVINLPAALLFGWNTWGLVLAYFMVQWAGVLVDRRLVRLAPGLRRAWCWFVLIAPTPLFFNEPILRILFLWPELGD